MTTETESLSPSYPAWMEVRRPDAQSRLLNFPLFIGSLIRSVLLIPHFIVLYFLGIVAALLYLIASVAILFSGRYPRGPYNFVAGVTRWSQRVNCYYFCLYDKYPAFSLDHDESYPLTFGVEYPQTSSRLLNLPIIGLLIKSVLLIPHIVVIYFLYLAAAVVLFIAQFAVLFAGAFPAGMHRFITGVLRWNLRLDCYLYGLVDRYPPFSMS